MRTLGVGLVAFIAAGVGFFTGIIAIIAAAFLGNGWTILWFVGLLIVFLVVLVYWARRQRPKRETHESSDDAGTVLLINALMKKDE